MLVDVNKLFSHPHKPLFKHVDGVIEKVGILTKNLPVAKMAELVAIFHDLGKINPNFQDKLFKRKPKGYAHHAYFSAFAFYCAFLHIKENFYLLKNWLGVERLSVNEIVAFTIIIAKHHGHLLDFIPQDKDVAQPRILNKQEIEQLYLFLDERKEELPSIDFSRKYMQAIHDFEDSMFNENNRKHFLNNFTFDKKRNFTPLEFFLKIQFSFAALILADKTDAADFQTIDADKKAIADFANIYQTSLDKFMAGLNQDSALNKLRTKIRLESVKKINVGLKKGRRIFELTSPTGSGKTLMLLSLAGEILKFRKTEKKEPLRIIYALPFLSITEQVEGEVAKIFKGYEESVQRIDSKSENKRFAEINEQLDDNPSNDLIKKLGGLTFQENTFAYPLVITTFVRFFQTLLSNYNSTLLKLPNFSKSIFLLDEIQSLPPRLYTFFVAYLEKFCELFDSYAVISTATQPDFRLPTKQRRQSEKAKYFFSDYQVPFNLLDHKKYFTDDIFNRYKINFKTKEIDLKSLQKKVLAENNSVLIILNTIDDSKDLFKELRTELKPEELVLLNTHFTPNDRKAKIKYIKERLKNRDKIIVISTQLIEAGVDIDFPVLYRDFALISSIVQSVGRCNRNGKLDFGKVVLFRLINRNVRRAELIYGRGLDKSILQITKDSLREGVYEEKKLLSVQQNFFSRILEELPFAKHTQKKNNVEIDFIEDITNCMYRKIGQFKLIDEDEFGVINRYYIPKSPNDNSFNILELLQESLLDAIASPQKDYSKIVPRKHKINELLREMAGNIVQVRIKKEDTPPVPIGDECLGILPIALTNYSPIEGVKLKAENQLI